MSDEFFTGVDQAVETLNLGEGGARLQEVMRLSRELMSALDLEQAMAAAGEAVRQVCNAERFVVLLAGPSGLEAKAARDAAGADLPLPPTLPLEPCEHAFKSGELVHTQQQRWKQPRLCGFAAVPMVGAHGPVGVIYSDGETRFVQRLDGHAQEMLMLLASHAAMAVGNAQLIAKVQAGQPETRVQFERRLHDELQRATRYGRPFSVVYLDVIGADELIARYDLVALDDLMAAVGSEVAQVCRTSDVLARVGPARLGLLVPEPPDAVGEQQGLRALSARLQEQLARAPLRVRDLPQRVRIVLGGVSYQQAPLVGIKGVLHEAELAVEVARRDGADHFILR